MFLILIKLSVRFKEFFLSILHFCPEEFEYMFKLEAFSVLVVSVFQSCADLLLNAFFFVSVIMSDEKIYFGISSFL